MPVICQFHFDALRSFDVLRTARAGTRVVGAKCASIIYKISTDRSVCHGIDVVVVGFRHAINGIASSIKWAGVYDCIVDDHSPLQCRAHLRSVADRVHDTLGVGVEHIE